MKLYEYAIRRLILMVFVLLGLSLLIFYLARGLLPPTFAIAPYITARMNDAAKLSVAQGLGVATSTCPSFGDFAAQQAGCLTPLWSQYFAWFTNALTGNWGLTQLPGISGTDTTWHIFFKFFPDTVQLAITAGIITIAVGIPLGIISATRNNKLPDHISRVVSLAGYSVPQYWFGLTVGLIFGLYITLNGSGVLPASGDFSTTCGLCFTDPGTITKYSGIPLLDSVLSLNFAHFWDSFVSILLPAITLAVTSIGALTRIVRSSMMEVLRQDYILLARSKGLKDRVVIYRHALRNALLPAVTVSGLLLTYFFGGVVIIEYVFSYPGVGNAALLAAEVHDVNFLELYVLVTGVIIVVTNLLVDIVYAKFDPRIRY